MHAVGRCEKDRNIIYEEVTSLSEIEDCETSRC